MSRRPRIAVVGRFSEHTSATRYAAVVNARKLLELIWEAGGEPLTLLPVADSDWAERLAGIDGVLMPGGSDVSPARYNEKPESEELYGIDDLQDSVDISLVRYVLAHGIPLFTICRGTQVTNVALGGSLLQHMDEPHRHHVAEVKVHSNVDDLGLTTDVVQASCYHHQILKQLGQGVEPIAFAAEGHVEAVRYQSSGWAFGVQWHPEDNYETDPSQLEMLKRFVEACKA